MQFALQDRPRIEGLAMADEGFTRRILYVDDNEDCCQMLSVLLGREGYEVTTARSPVEGLDIVAMQSFILIILDNKYNEGGSGVELCVKIRATDTRTPIVFYSAAAYEQDVEEALKAGAQAYVAKPRVDELQQAVELLIQGNRAHT